MKDYIKDFCRYHNIKLSYIESDSIILKWGIQNGGPAIILNQMFQNCTKNISEAVISYCKGYENVYYDLIESYAKDNLYSLEYIIEPPDKKIRSLLKQNTNQKDNDIELKEKTDKHPGMNPGMNELEIKSIKYKDFWGNKNEVSSDSSINTSSDDIIDLDITIDDYSGNENENK